MTTEVVLMNKSAVAMATDSAVTITGPTGTKVYDSVNKLFELVRGRPIGVMVYNSGDINGVPWETVIKEYRDERQGLSFPTVQDYANDFLDFLRSATGLFPKEQEASHHGMVMYRAALEVRASIVAAIEAALSRPTTPMSPADVEAEVEKQVLDLRTSRATITPPTWASPMTVTSFLRRNSKVVNEVVIAAFQSLPISPKARTALRWLLAQAAILPNPGAFSGLVFAGFGSEEHFPRMREYEIFGLIDGTLVSKEGDAHVDISLHNPAAVQPFAQGDMVRSFTDGIQDQVRRVLNDYWMQWANSVKAETTTVITNRHPGLPTAQVDDLAEVFASIARDGVQQFFDSMTRHEKESVKDPVLQSLAFLPKDEMGAMAESLVNLTTLKRRVSINEIQTVGGAVDVAVISKGDGFVWLKRKHYFDVGLNPHWMSRHTSTI